MDSKASSADRQGSGPPESGWFWLDNLAAECMRNVGAAAFAVYGVLAKHAGRDRRCFPSIDTIGKCTGLARGERSSSVSPAPKFGGLYVRDLLLRLHADDPCLEEMLPDHWAAAHPEAILTHRLEESRSRAVRTRARRAHRRARQRYPSRRDDVIFRGLLVGRRRTPPPFASTGNLVCRCDLPVGPILGPLSRGLESSRLDDFLGRIKCD